MDGFLKRQLHNPPDGASKKALTLWERFMATMESNGGGSPKPRKPLIFGSSDAVPIAAIITIMMMLVAGGIWIREAEIALERRVTMLETSLQDHRTDPLFHARIRELLETEYVRRNDLTSVNSRLDRIELSIDALRQIMLQKDKADGQ